jgi:hypothetical protein
LACLGGLIGIAYYVGVFILPDPQAYLKLYSFDFAETNQLPIQNLSIPNLIQAFQLELDRYDIYQQNLNFALIGASFIYLLYRGMKQDRNLTFFVAVTFAVFALVRGSKNEFYAILLFPFMVIMVTSSSLNPQRLFVSGLLAFVIISSGLHLIRPIQENRDYDYDLLTERMRAVVPDGARVMGLPTWWLGFTDYDYRSSLSLNFYYFFNGYGLEEGLEAIRADIIIIDSVLRAAMESDDILGSPYYSLPGDEFRAFLDERGELLLNLEDTWHGPIEVYAIAWDTEPATG